MKPALLLVPLALLASLPWTACTSSPVASIDAGDGGETSAAGQRATGPSAGGQNAAEHSAAGQGASDHDLTDQNAAGQSPADGGRGPTTNGDRFGDSSCRACQAEACASQEADCTGEPACARYLDCLDACPLTSDGALDATCASACPRPSAASVALLANALDACREKGSGLDCECGAPSTLPDILNQDCPASTDENACYKCEDERCCETYATCHASPECTAFMTCLKTCDADVFTQCIVDCGQQHPQGVDQGLARTSCIFMRCPDADTCGDKPLDPCVKCGDERCTNEVLACSLSYACQKIDACASDCTTAECYASCYAGDPPAAADFKSYIGCVTEQCASECG